MSTDHYCSACGMTLDASVSSCSDHGVVCCGCFVHVAPGLAEYVGDLMLANRGAWACPDCADEITREAHEQLNDDEPHTCSSCERAKARAEETRLAAMQAKLQADMAARDQELSDLRRELFEAECNEREEVREREFANATYWARKASRIRVHIEAMGVEVDCAAE